MVSGFGLFEEITDFNFTVNVTVNDDTLSKAKKVIESMGGTLDSPHVNTRDAMDNAEINYAEIVSKLRDTEL